MSRYQMQQMACPMGVAIKADSSPVSVVDIATERTFRKSLRDDFPTDSVQGEELGATEVADYNWVIDPIDGTRKFIRGIPTWGISIALEYRSKVIAAAIAVPATGEVWSAIDQGGAFKNGARIKVSTTAKIKDAYITTSARKYFSEINQLACYDEIHAHALHDPGFLDVYSFAMLCDGRIDGIVTCQDNWWDIAAATFILKESGGCYSLSADPPRLDNGVNYFSNGKIHRKLSSIIRGVIR
ncbi:inositol monophosphatase [Pseudomonas sp. R4-39-08]|uniref:inositol monophosphatase family protein n=1 Tax=Pseudomonas sp. R4-39-08 TaxID=1173288 RepID=UPI0013DE4A74|nr:inositol monophosphatase [Pseudomonas sp. R4-39-08]